MLSWVVPPASRFLEGLERGGALTAVRLSSRPLTEGKRKGAPALEFGARSLSESGRRTWLGDALVMSTGPVFAVSWGEGPGKGVREVGGSGGENPGGLLPPEASAEVESEFFQTCRAFALVLAGLWGLRCTAELLSWWKGLFFLFCCLGMNWGCLFSLRYFPSHPQ